MHSQCCGSAGKRIAIRLAGEARKRQRLEQAQAEFREQAIVAAAVEAAGVVATTEAEEVFCAACGLRRKLIFENGKRARAVCPCRKIGAKRRRMTFKQPDVLGAFNPNSGGTIANFDTILRGDAGGHILMIADEMTFCSRCGAYSTERIHGLGAACTGVPGPGQAFRLSRLRKSRHPLTNLAFTGPVKHLRVV